MSLNSAARAVAKSIPECMAAGFVDAKTGTLLGMKTVDSDSQNALDIAAAAAGNLFQGSSVVTIDEIFSNTEDGAKVSNRSFQEVIVLSSNLTHVFQRCKQHKDIILVVITRMSANIGMVLARSRMELPKFEASL